MPSYCQNCGAELIKNEQFCAKSGKNVSEQPLQPSQPQDYNPLEQQPRKFSSKHLAIIAVIVVVIIVISIVLLVLLGGNNSFIGKWEVRYSSGGPEVIWTVYENGSVLQEHDSYTIWGLWEQKGNQVCGYWEPNPYDYRCFTIEYSDGGNKITAYYQGMLFGTATRIE